MSKSRNRIGRRKKNNSQTHKKILLGTSLIPQGELRAERIALNTKSIKDYIEKKNKAKKDGLSKEEINSIRRNPVELRVDFIPFKGDKELHAFEVNRKAKKIQDEYIKKWNGEDKYSIVTALKKYKRTSK